ncbi:MAG: Nramp family divalent metal transporter [Armatimonadetes bacterium]|nr:Nramp family divalent metal transporter [Armatimonadota bacterium]
MSQDKSLRLNQIDLQIAEMPAKTQSFWQLAGPGAILVGLSIGAGEIVVWPRIAAEYGASMVWAATVGIFIQLWINFEIARWTIVTGESVFAGFSRVWRGFAAVFLLFTVFGWIAPGWAKTSGLALKALLVGPQGFGSGAFWTSVTFAFVALLLFGPKAIYNSVEKTIEALVVIIVVGLLCVAIAVGTSGHWVELAQGMVNFGHVERGMDVKALFIAMTFAGAGGTANLFYSFYLRDKHIGMGARIPSLQNPIRGRTEKLPTVGFTYDDNNPENARQFRAWFKYAIKDQTLFFWFLNTVTILLFIFGALCVLHPSGLVPQAGTLIWDEAEVLAKIWGKFGRTVFLIVGVATLFSTELALVDGCARSVADILYFNVPAARKRDLAWWYMVVAGTWIVFGTWLTWFMEKRNITELGFLFNAAYVGGFAMAVYVPLLLYMNYRYLPRSARPNWVCTFFMIVASLVYGGFAVASILWETGVIR